MPTIEVLSSAFEQGAPIPERHAYGTENESPPLRWAGVPSGTESIAVICDDPDAPAGTWVHWVLYDLDGAVNELAAGISDSEIAATGASQGKNDFGDIGYGGPWPPPGKPHRYFFRVYAVDTKTGLEPGATKAELLAALEGHILAQGELMGTYQR